MGHMSTPEQVVKGLEDTIQYLEARCEELQVASARLVKEAKAETEESQATVAELTAFVLRLTDLSRVLETQRVSYTRPTTLDFDYADLKGGSTRHRVSYARLHLQVEGTFQGQWVLSGTELVGVHGPSPIDDPLTEEMAFLVDRVTNPTHIHRSQVVIVEPVALRDLPAGDGPTTLERLEADLEESVSQSFREHLKRKPL